MRRLLLFLLAGLLITSCGGDDDEHSPEIFNLEYSPRSAMAGEGPAFVSVYGTVEFMDQEKIGNCFRTKRE
jgi:hypothetical protein